MTDEGAAGGDKPSLGDRLRSAFLKPPPASSESPEPNPPPTLEELEAANRAADDRERAVGLFAAPFAALISLLVISDLNNHNKLNVGSSSVYTELLLVLLALSVAMLAFAWFRKRLLLGIVMALYGLAVFNLKYWGFGIPFLIGGAWLLVRAYRAQRAVREATPDVPGTRGTGGGNGSRPTPPPSKRYTPPSAPKRSSSPRSDKDGRTG